MFICSRESISQSLGYGHTCCIVVCNEIYISILSEAFEVDKSTTMLSDESSYALERRRRASVLEQLVTYFSLGVLPSSHVIKVEGLEICVENLLLSPSLVGRTLFNIRATDGAEALHDR